jgi:hypothetical protein
MRRDDGKHQKLYLDWKEKSNNGISGISDANSRVILNYVNDMEYGLNVGRSSKKGGRKWLAGMDFGELSRN